MRRNSRFKEQRMKEFSIFEKVKDIRGQSEWGSGTECWRELGLDVQRWAVHIRKLVFT